MMTPETFMLYATPVAVLIAHLISEELARNRASKLAALTVNTAAQLSNVTALQAMRVSDQVKLSSAANAEASANLTVQKMEVPGGKMDVIHGLTNGTLSIANSKIEALQLELARLKEAQSEPTNVNIVHVEPTILTALSEAGRPSES